MRDEGRFIVLEGGEGVGKTTQVDLLGSWLEEAGIPHRVTREPGGTPVGEAIRSIVLGRTDLQMPPESELFLIVAAPGNLIIAISVALREWSNRNVERR